MATFGKTDNTTLLTGAPGSTGSQTIGSAGLLTTGGTLTAVRVHLASAAGFNDVRFAVYQGGLLSGTNGDPTGAALIWDSGDLQNTLLVSQTITAATNGANCQFTITSPNMSAGDRILFRSMTGGTWSSKNLTSCAVTNVSGNTVTTDLDSTSLGTFSSGNCSAIRWYEISASGTLAANENTWLMLRTGGQAYFWTSADATDFTSGTGSYTGADGNASNDTFASGNFGNPIAQDWTGSINASQQLVGAIVYTPAASSIAPLALLLGVGS